VETFGGSFKVDEVDRSFIGGARGGSEAADDGGSLDDGAQELMVSAVCCYCFISLFIFLIVKFVGDRSG